MSENRTIRINKVLRELNISLESAIDFLKKLNVKIEESPNAKISEEEYFILTNEFKNRPKKISILENELKIQIYNELNYKNFDIWKPYLTYECLNEKVISLNLEGVKINNLAFLKKFVELQNLKINGCNLENINYINLLKELKSLDISNNNIKDISNLKFNKRIKKLNFTQNDQN